MFLHHDFPPEHPFSRLRVSPEMPGSPEVWLLGSSMWSAEAAAQFGLPYSFAHFFSPVHTRAAIEHYTEFFRASQYSQQARKSVAVGVLCAETEEEAELMMASPRLLTSPSSHASIAPPRRSSVSRPRWPSALLSFSSRGRSSPCSACTIRPG